ncbi:RNase adapter RapZ [Vitreoscilla stercoraria]|uniref:RNase adapter RapZ n=1 Tax=Vitreoscilla stercoraria TaxID=61 RepID=A0ABY4ED30_VITST|nr:RNase adapter RapZ [Vitreoscilla stercoraria]UOO93637.1 RNase adapter RapZ [Vitreoscilla stercoraria]
MRVILISGLSGSGKSIALKSLEDLGFFCVDNLPLELLPHLVMWYQSKSDTKHLAICLDMRAGMSQEHFLPMLEAIKKSVRQFDVLYLEAKTEILLNRFSETRRRHPLTHDNCTLAEALKYEREWLYPLREHAHVVDTSALSTPKLRQYITAWVNLPKSNLQIVFQSFGFKYGIPSDADFVLDVRSLPNPHYEASLRALTGKDKPVAIYFKANPVVQDMINDITAYLNKWLPRIEQENRSYVTVAIGCTGGQHRSVYIVEQLALSFKAASKNEVLIRHRQL